MSQSDAGEPELPEHDPGEPEPPDWAVLERVAAGQASAADREAVERWIGLDPRRRAELDLLRRVVGGTRALGATEFDARAGLARAETRLGLIGMSPGGADDQTPSRIPSPASERARQGLRVSVSGASTRASRLPQPRPRGVGGASAWRVAAAVMAVAVGASLAIGIGRHRGGFGEAAGREYATAAGHRLSVTLVDGTQLTLAPASRVRLAADYGRPVREREVDLEGEAYFAVVHDDRHPFAVHARNAVAEDLGTQFVMRAYPGDPVVRVAVAEGRVSMITRSGGLPAARPSQSPSVVPVPGASRSPDALVRGDVATVTDTGVAVMHGADIAAMTAWTRGELRFVRVPLREVLVELGRWYDLDIRTDDAVLGARPVTASFPTTSADTVFTTLAAAFEVHWHRSGRVVVLTDHSR